jgi:nitrite reductase (NADH) large subunit
MAAVTFPNYTQIPSRIPVAVWHGMRAVSIAGALVVAGLLVAVPATGLFVMWKVIIPTLPALFMVAPGLWRNLCPLAASNQTPRALKITRAMTAPGWLKEYGYVIAFTLFGTFVFLRRVGLSRSGPLSAALLLGAMAAAFAGGLALKGKSGWCSTICPLLPVQRIYGQTPLVMVANSHCQPCVGCVKNCYDFNPRAAYLADLHDADNYWSGYRRFFVGAFPGIVLGFFVVPNGSALSILGGMAVCTTAALASYALLTTFVKRSAHTFTTLYGAIAFSLFYWFVAANLGPGWLTWAIRVAAIALAATWVVRTLRNERPFLERAAAPPAAAPPAAAPAAALTLALAGSRAAAANAVTFVPENKHVVPKPGQSLLEIAEANGLAIEAGCRMGVCGADPVAIKEGMECASPISDDERATLERLGLAPNTRLACCVRVSGPVTVSLTPDKATEPNLTRVAGFDYDRDVRRVVVIGNGIAGVTAADHIRRRHPDTEIDLVADEPHHLYNRMGISRLVYGRSAMQGLYLNPESWYDERGITAWLNTRALSIDRGAGAGAVALGTGEKLPYDRLILATGARSYVPPIEGFGAPGTGVLRSAADAMALRAYAQQVGSRRAIVAGGGLLGLEAAYALLKVGVKTVVLERSSALLRRQLDARAGELLRNYLEGLGIEVLVDAEVAGVDAGSRLRAVRLRDGRRLDAQMLLVAAGIEPNAELAREAGVATGRGVLVDDHMRTDDPAILAAGDVAEFAGQVPGLWPPAVAQAEVAAENAVGGDKVYVPPVPVTILKVVGIELASLGRFEAGGPEEQTIAFEDAAAGRYRKLVIADGRIVGAILLGHGNDVAAVRTAITYGFDVRGTLDALRAGSWDVLARLGGDQPLEPAAAA